MSDKEKINKLISEADKLLNENCTIYSTDFTTWKNNCIIFLQNKYGKDSPEYECFKKINFAPFVFLDEVPQYKYIQSCQKGIQEAKGILEGLLDYMPEAQISTPKCDMSKIFIVHGHDEAFKLKIKDFLTQLGIEGIILHDQPNVGRTIIEKIEHFGKDVGAAIILYTPDDEGRSNKETGYKSRARQNVVFESGFFIGFLGREKVAHVVADSNMEIPGDLSGVVYVDKDKWQFDLVRELKAMGFQVDANKLI